MRLYSGTTKSLVEDATFNRLAYKLRDDCSLLSLDTNRQRPK